MKLEARTAEAMPKLRKKISASGREMRQRWSMAGVNVVSQEVVDIEAGTGDGRFLVDAGVRTMPVIEVSPRC